MKYLNELKVLVYNRIRDIERSKPIDVAGIEMNLEQLPKLREIAKYLNEQVDRVLDDLLAGIPKVGYYLKLYKEVEPNSFEFKLKIDAWQGWTDLESEIANIVKIYTELTPDKWGSGTYRVVVYREGVADQLTLKPINFLIDACKEVVSN